MLHRRDPTSDEQSLRVSFFFPAPFANLRFSERVHHTEGSRDGTKST
jgi:hypothetical protein